MKHHHYMKYLFVLLLSSQLTSWRRTRKRRCLDISQNTETGGCERNRESSSLHQTQGILSQLPDQRLCNEILQRRHRGVLHQPEEWKDGSQCLFQKKSSQQPTRFRRQKASIHGQRQRNLPTLAGREDTY